MVCEANNDGFCDLSQVKVPLALTFICPEFGEIDYMMYVVRVILPFELLLSRLLSVPQIVI